MYYTTRVELHHASTVSDYTNLHALMQQEGFSRTVNSSDGHSYQLPPAEYLKTGTYAIADVLNAAVRAAQRTGRHSSVLVTAGAELTWNGLVRV
jgi:hypothetical protein